MKLAYWGLKDRSIFFIFILILITSIAAVLLYDYKAQSEYRNERAYYFEKSHEKAYSSTYLYTEQLNSLYSQMLLNRNLTTWLNNPGELISDMYKLSEIQNSFFDLINSYSGIESIYLHNKRNNMVLSTHSMLSELTIFPKKEAFEQFYKSGQSFMWNTLENPDDNLSMIYAIGKIGAVSINLNPNHMADQVLDGNPYLLWLDKYNKVLLSSDKELGSFYSEHAEYIVDMKQASFFYKEHFIINSESNSRGWRLLTIIPQSELLRKSGQSTYKYVVILLCLTMGALMFFYFRYVRREQEKVSAVKFQRNLEDFRVGLITDLLNGRPVLTNIEEKAKEYQIDLSGQAYQVVVFQIDNYYNYLLSKSNSERFFMNKIIFSAIKWTFALKYNAYIVNTELEKVTILLCYELSDDANAVQLENTIRYIQDDINLNSGLTVCAGVSELTADISHVPSCYTHARMALDYKSIYGKHAIIYYEQLSSAKPSSYDRTNVEISKISTYLKEGRIEDIVLIVDNTLQEMIDSEEFRLDWIDAIFANMMATIMKFVIEHRIDINHHCQEDVFITLYSYEFLDEKKAHIIKICSIIINLMHDTHDESNSNASIKLIVDYIDKYYDKPISLTILANELNLSPSYLSVFIKNHLGIGFLDYLIKLRIQKAIKLLDNNDLTIQKIAEDCGYDTVHTFIRHFKKAYHMPPNEYRNRKRNTK